MKYILYHLHCVIEEFHRDLFMYKKQVKKEKPSTVISSVKKRGGSSNSKAVSRFKRASSLKESGEDIKRTEEIRPPRPVSNGSSRNIHFRPDVHEEVQEFIRQTCKRCLTIIRILVESALCFVFTL